MGHPSRSGFATAPQPSAEARMNARTHHETPPEERIPFMQKVVYGAGAFVNNTLAGAIGGMIIILNLGLGMNPALVGLVAALPRLTDAITDPLMGYISDHTASRWGRRRPYIFVGAILAGLTYILLWQLPRGQSETFYFWVFLAGSFVFYLAYTVFATPWVALGYELTPDYHERTRLMGVQNFIGQLAYLVSPWWLWVMQNEALFDDLLAGAQGLSVGVAVVTIAFGILPAIFLRERSPPAPPEVEIGIREKKYRVRFANLWENVKGFVGGFVATLKVKPFLQLCGATFLVFNGFMLISSFQVYVIIYYVFQGDQALGSEYSGYAGTIQGFAAFGVISLVTWLACKIGKRRAFFVSTGISMVGYLLKWPCYDPDAPLLLLAPVPLIAFGLGGLFTLMGSMVADVVDYDEVQTHERREGMFGSIFWWVVKLGMAAALAAGGFLLNWTGFDVTLGGNQSETTLLWMRLCDIFVPVLFSGIAIFMVATYPLTEQRALEIRAQLESRRGEMKVAEAA
jgi:GPH family glycoside/pentoside/hexuronide:cation symporter